MKKLWPLLLTLPLIAQGPLPWLWTSIDGKTSGWKSSTILGQIPITGIPCVSVESFLQIMVKLPNDTCLPLVVVSPTGIVALEVNFNNPKAVIVLDPNATTTK